MPFIAYKGWYEQTMKSYHFRNPDGYVIVTYASEPLGERYLKRLGWYASKPLPLSILTTTSTGSVGLTLARIYLLKIG